MIAFLHGGISSSTISALQEKYGGTYQKWFNYSVPVYDAYEEMRVQDVIPVYQAGTFNGEWAAGAVSKRVNLPVEIVHNVLGMIESQAKGGEIPMEDLTPQPTIADTIEKAAVEGKLVDISSVLTQSVPQKITAGFAVLTLGIAAGLALVIFAGRR